MKFTEDTRVKIPVILHLIRLGYHYLSLKEQRWDKETNIFPDLFTAAIGRINPGLAPDDIGRLLKDLTLLLDNDDLGRAFFEKLSDRSGIKLIDLKWSTKTGHRVRVFSSIDFPIRLVVTHHYIRAVLVRCNIQRYSPLLRELHR